jgi:hypothetical protein
MNEKTATLLNRYVAHVYATVTRGKDLPPHSQHALKQITKKKVYREWNSTPGPQRASMRRRLLHEMRAGTVAV